MYSEEDRLRIDAELARAESARAAGNEGMARVCARRAAGQAVRSFLGGRAGAGSAYDLLAVIQEDAQVSQALKDAAAVLRLRVDENHQLPLDADLIAEARILVGGLALLLEQ